ncbi:helix-turn-helix domain-containing protein [Deinococcus aquaticus]|uniref:ATP-binding protein n=1 Tax=Deinococcus aquaticus TaxID=328692 RepID=A0ABY7V1A2_9DEIO|nr:ATP-binding protein [Deinococcus aquaticus]WDA58963.1 ATP-binding protein [Deinococcus aquaticus]
MNSSEFLELISRKESSVLDFKREWHDNNIKLLHDIICLSNAYSDDNRCIVIGIDNSGALEGVESDINRKNEANLQDMLRSSGLNRIPDLSLIVYSDEIHQYDVIEILNRPDKPFFLTRDRSERGSTMRSGVVYTRLGDTNTPLSESAPEDRMELMWRERFGIGKPPLERFHKLLDDHEKWIYPKDDRELYNSDFPEFHIRLAEKINDPYQESWTDKFPDRYAYSRYIELRYFGTLISALGFVVCDGGRYTIPIPDIDINTDNYFIMRQSIKYKTASLINKSFRFTGGTLDGLLDSVGITVH